MADRRFDIVVFDATGLTGGLTAEYLTPAVAMGPALRTPLEAAGIDFKVLDGLV